jgi:hypothetical protein
LQDYRSTALDVRAEKIMRIPLLLRRLAWAWGLSIMALAAAVAIQAGLLFPQDFQMLHEPHETSIRQFRLTADGKRAMVLLRHLPRVLLHEPRLDLHECELEENHRLIHDIDFGFIPWSMACARGTQQVFVGSRDGGLYCFDRISPTSRPRFLGRHVEGAPYLLECTPSGSRVIMGDTGCISAWSTATATCLWHRADINVVSAHFHSATGRLYCELNSGRCVELDWDTGATLCTIAEHREAAQSLDVSTDGRYLATLGFHGLYAVTDLESGREAWSMRLPMQGVGPRFSPDGRCVLTPAPAREAAVLVLSTTTGELLAELRGAKAQIAGIEVTTSGIVYAWDHSETLTAWDLATHKLLRQFKLTS